jgi:hypothetical protein
MKTLSVLADPTYVNLMEIKSRFGSIFIFVIGDAKKLLSEYVVIFTFSSQPKFACLLLMAHKL